MHSVLPGLLRRIADAGWNLRVEAREMITSQQLRALRAGELDLGFGRPGKGEPLAEEVAGMDDPYCLARAPSHPLAAGEGALPLQSAAHEPFVGFARYEDADYFDRTVALCLDAGFTPSIRHEAGQFVNVLALVACGLGVAIVPSSFASLYRGKLVFRPLQESRYQSRLAVLAVAGSTDGESDAGRVAQAAALELKQFGRRLARLR